MQIIYEPFVNDDDWPVFQHVNVIAWQELTSAGAAEPREIYTVLSNLGFVAPPVPAAQSWQLRDDTQVRLTLLGLTHLDEATDDIERFLTAMNHIAERAAQFRPASPAVVERLKIDGDEIGLAVKLDPGDRALHRLALLLREDAPVWTGFAGPDPSAGWSLEVDVEVARRFRGVSSVEEFLAVDRARRGPPPEVRFAAALPSPPEGAFVWTRNDGRLYLFADDALHPTDEVTLFAMGANERQIVEILPAQVAKLGVGDPVGKMFPNGTLVKATGDAVFQIEDGHKRWVPDIQTFGALSHGQNVYKQISDVALDAIPDGPPVPSVRSVSAAKPEPRRSPLFGRLKFVPPTVGFLADIVVVVSALGGLAKLLHVW